MTRWQKIKSYWTDSKSELFDTEEAADRRYSYRLNSGEWERVCIFQIKEGENAGRWLVHSRNYGVEE